MFMRRLGIYVVIICFLAGCTNSGSTLKSSDSSEKKATTEQLVVKSQQKLQVPDEKALTTNEPNKSVGGDPCQPVNLALKYTVGDLTTYRMITENQRQAFWDGPASQRPEGFVGGQTSTRAEITFDQVVKSVNDRGNAILWIKITGIKYQSIVKDNIVLDFNSVKETNRNRPLYKVLGSNYTIEATPSGQVVRIIDVNNVKTGFITATTENQTADKLVSNPVIKERHTITTLVSAAQTQVNVGQSWNVNETTSFDLMGTRTYLKTYTLAGVIQEPDGRKTALIRLRANVSPKQEQATSSLPLNINEAYTGLLKLSLDTGKIEQIREEMVTEWAVQADVNQPVSLRISAARLYSCEQLTK
jgi:hypothetical protein